MIARDHIFFWAKNRYFLDRGLMRYKDRAVRELEAQIDFEIDVGLNREDAGI